MIVIRNEKVITMTKVNALGRGRPITRVYVDNIVTRIMITQKKRTGRTQLRHVLRISSIVSGATVYPRDRGVGGLIKLCLLGSCLDAIFAKALFSILAVSNRFQELGSFGNDLL